MSTEDDRAVADLRERHGWPRCALCGVNVDNVVIEDGDFAKIVTVYCHGAQERVEIPYADLMAEDLVITFTEAFVNG